MFKKSTQTVFTDLLFNLLLSFVVLFFLAFLMVAEDSKKKQENANNGNNILISLKWEKDNDIDVWLQLPDGRRVGYNQRDMPPAHLDVDVVHWRRYEDSTGEKTIIKDNEEVITIRDKMLGEYVVNVHYYGVQQLKENERHTEIEIMIQDVAHAKVVYYTKKVLQTPGIETHIVRFTLEELEVPEGMQMKEGKKYVVTNVTPDRPVYFLGRGPDPQNMEVGGDE